MTTFNEGSASRDLKLSRGGLGCCAANSMSNVRFGLGSNLFGSVPFSSGSNRYKMLPGDSEKKSTIAFVLLFSAVFCTCRFSVS